VLLSEVDILKGYLNKEIDYFIVPGGSTSHMLAELRSKGVRMIHKYVKDGGFYIGICAGAYLAARWVDFQSEQLTLRKKRPLSFYPGIHKGPSTGVYSSEDNSGFRCVDVLVHDTKLSAYLNGGGVFVGPEKHKNVRILGRYETGEVCAVECAYGKGKAFLSAVHIEYQPQLMLEDEHIKREDIERLKLCNVERFDIWRKILNL
jgi:glutamine amidotransferase-like uncharacterized protein